MAYDGGQLLFATPPNIDNLCIELTEGNVFAAPDAAMRNIILQIALYAKNPIYVNRVTGKLTDSQCAEFLHNAMLLSRTDVQTCYRR